ncbi:MAG: lysostaphin resistance A-like protein, partial [Rubrobacter sp.]
SLLGRVLKWRVGLGWYLLVLVAFPALLVGIIAATMALVGQPFRAAFSGPWWLLPAFMPLVLFLGPLQEELGWRAFALPPLMERHGWISAGVVVGLAWAVWHRTPTTWSAISWSEPLGSAGLLGLMLGAFVPDVALSVLMAWVYRQTQGSALLAGLGMHTAANYALFLPAVPTGPSATTTTWALTWSFAGCLSILALLAASTGREADARPPRRTARRGYPAYDAPRPKDSPAPWSQFLTVTWTVACVFTSLVCAFRRESGGHIIR